VNEALPVPQLLEDERKRFADLEIEREDVSEQLRLAVRDRGASGFLNGRKKALNAPITDLRARI
jgi:hypothetical protein